jgi:type I restriction enzyme S subunit
MPKYPEKTIGELCDIIKGETGLASAIPGEYPLVTTGADRKSCNSYQFDTEAVCIPLVSSTGHGKKTLNYVHYQEGKFALGTILAALIPRDKNIFSAAYLHRYLQFYKDKKIVPLMKGAANVSLAVKEIAKIDIPIPPISQQTEFIKLFNKLHTTGSELQLESTAQSSLLTQLRQSILQEGIEGKLTADWRKANPVRKGNPEYDAEALLAKIKMEKQKLIEDGKIRKEKPIPPIKKDEIPFELPKGWVWTRFQDVTTLITDGKHGDCQDQLNSGYFFLSAKDIQNEKLVYDFARQINRTEFEEVHRRTNLLPGDICMVNTGATVGKLAIAPDDERTINTTFQKSVAVIKLIQHLTSNKYIKIFLNYDIKELMKKSWGSAINNLLLGDLKSKLIPLPPLSEQHMIVNSVENKLSILDLLEKQVNERKIQADRLLQTVLREAFEGKPKNSERKQKELTKCLQM